MPSPKQGQRTFQSYYTTSSVNLAFFYFNLFYFCSEGVCDYETDAQMTSLAAALI